MQRASPIGATHYLFSAWFASMLSEAPCLEGTSAKRIASPALLMPPASSGLSGVSCLEGTSVVKSTVRFLYLQTVQLLRVHILQLSGLPLLKGASVKCTVTFLFADRSAGSSCGRRRRASTCASCARTPSSVTTRSTRRCAVGRPSVTSSRTARSPSPRTPPTVRDVITRRDVIKWL